MCKGLQGSGQHLHRTEAFVHCMRTALGKHPLEDRHDDITDHKGDQRGEYQPLHNLDEPAPLDMV
ncbi:hypothetical protein D3C80_1942330 [compost metagenome]